LVSTGARKRARSACAALCLLLLLAAGVGPAAAHPGRPSETVATGLGSIVGKAWFVSEDGTPAGYMAFAAHADGAAAGSAGIFRPGWFEVLLDGAGVFFQVHRGALSQDELRISRDGTLAVLRLRLPKVGTIVMRLSAPAGKRPSDRRVGMGAGYGDSLGHAHSWSVERHLVGSRETALEGTAGAYSLIGVEPNADPRDRRPFAFISRAAVTRTCQDLENCGAFVLL
jgi:hypothetical protein